MRIRLACLSSSFVIVLPSLDGLPLAGRPVAFLRDYGAFLALELPPPDEFGQNGAEAPGEGVAASIEPQRARCASESVLWSVRGRAVLRHHARTSSSSTRRARPRRTAGISPRRTCSPR